MDFDSLRAKRSGETIDQDGHLRDYEMKTKTQMTQSFNQYSENETKGHFQPGGIFLAERHLLLFDDHLAVSGHQKTKENIILRGKFRLAEDGHKIWRQNILNQSKCVSSSCLHSHFVISLLSWSSTVSIHCLNTAWLEHGLPLA